MCGRFALDVTGEEIAAVFGVELGSARSWVPRWNLAPTMSCPVIRVFEDRWRLDSLRWGLVPPWRDDASSGSRMINARSETVETTSSYREAFARTRCLVPIRAFYEWRRDADGKSHPVAILPDDGDLLTLAGLWARNERVGEGGPLETFTILTTAAGSNLASVHHRMPVILSAADRARWMDARPPESGGAMVEELQAMFGRASDCGLGIRPVSMRVNSPKHDGPSLLDRVEASIDELPGLFD
ncbi:MAG: DUF159 family protein [Phycisphaerae bacterium]|nr:DUF159 family protein [Phycisphaerae bacterium]